MRGCSSRGVLSNRDVGTAYMCVMMARCICMHVCAVNSENEGEGGHVQSGKGTCALVEG